VQNSIAQQQSKLANVMIPKARITAKFHNSLPSPHTHPPQTASRFVQAQLILQGSPFNSTIKITLYNAFQWAIYSTKVLLSVGGFQPPPI